MTSDVLHFSLDGFFSVVRRGVKASPLHHMDWSARVAVFGLPAQVGIYLIINVSKHWHHGRIAQWISFDGTGRIVRAGICCFVSWLRPALCRRGRQSRDGFSWNNEVSDNFFISVVEEGAQAPCDKRAFLLLMMAHLVVLAVLLYG